MKNDLLMNAVAIDNMKNREGILLNASGYEQATTTLTHIKSAVKDQKFYEVMPSEFIPITVGEGAWADNLLTYQTFSNGDGFESGIVDVANTNRLAEDNTEISAVSIKTVAWAKQSGYSLIDVNKAQRSGNWSLIEKKERARKKGWDLGIQKIAFLGHNSDTEVLGLLNQTGVETDTATITKKLSSMTDTEFQTFVSVVLGLYESNTEYTERPDTFLIPRADFLGLVRSTSETYPINNRLMYLENAFKQATGNANFKIEGLVYCDQTRNNLSKNRYVLYKKDVDCLEMNIPVDYTTTSVGTINNFQWQSVAYGQFTGIKLYRPKTMYYMDYAN